MMTAEEIKKSAVERAQIYLDQAIKRREGYVAELSRYAAIYEKRKESQARDSSAWKIARILDDIQDEIDGVDMLIKSYKKFLFLERVKNERF